MTLIHSIISLVLWVATVGVSFLSGRRETLKQCGLTPSHEEDSKLGWWCAVWIAAAVWELAVWAATP